MIHAEKQAHYRAGKARANEDSSGQIPFDRKIPIQIVTSKSYMTVDDPNTRGMTVVNGLNDKGQLVGFYLDAAGNTDGMLLQVTGEHHGA